MPGIKITIKNVWKLIAYLPGLVWQSSWKILFALNLADDFFREPCSISCRKSRIHFRSWKKGVSTTSQFVIDPTFLNTLSWKARPYLSFFKGSFIFYKLFKTKEVVFTNLWNTVSHSFYVCRRQPARRSGHKIKWIILRSLMRKTSQWFIKKKMMITGHRIQAGSTRHRLRLQLILQTQHQPYP